MTITVAPPTNRNYNRIADVLCRTHRTEALTTGWWFPPDLITGLLDTCASCADTCRPLPSSADGMQWFQGLRDLSDWHRDYHHAVHEAGHAVVGLLTGHPLYEVVVSDDQENGPGGWVRWGPWRVPVQDHLAMIWAGEQAALRWLTESDLDDRANRIDVHSAAASDVTEIADVAGRHRVDPMASRSEAAKMVLKHWPAITALADALTIRRRMTGFEVSAFLNSAAPRRRWGRRTSW